jgi:putative ABC transport system substrate-binding protein
MRLVALVLLAFLAAAAAASAQQSGRVYKIGYLFAGTPGEVRPPFEKWTGQNAVFVDALRDKGFAVGKNLVVEVRLAGGDVSRLPALAESLVAWQPDVIVSPGTAATVAAMRATKTIPIVFVGLGGPVEKGIVASLAKPGGNVTGIAVNVETSKMSQLLRDAAPSLRRLGWVAYEPNTFAHNRTPEYRAGRIARLGTVIAQEGFEFVDLFVDSLDELEPKVAALASRGEAALFMSTDPMLFSWRASIMAMALRYRLPTACAQSFGWGEAGCLITYGEDPYDLRRRGAAQVAKILNGTKPADIPVEQPTKFNLIVNARTAKALGLTLPPSLFALADEVIE